MNQNSTLVTFPVRQWLGRSFSCAALLALTTSFAPPALAARDHYDLVVYGGTPQGVAAATAAAHKGLKVLLAEPGPHLGGVLTRGWLATLDVSQDPTGAVMHGGLFRKFYRDLGHDNSFDVGAAQRSLTQLLPKAVDVRYETTLTRLAQKDGRITRIHLLGPRGPWNTGASYLIDATDTADAAFKAGAKFTTGREDSGIDKTQMASTLVFRISGVNWEALRQELVRENQQLRNGAGISGRSVVGLWPAARSYRPSNPQRFRLRGLNAARQNDGSLLVNALLIFGVNGLDPVARQRAWEEGRQEVRRVTDHLKQVLPGPFAGARLTGVAPEIYVRESRHLRGLVRLRADDVLYGRSFPDGIASGAYPLDGQAYLPFESAYLLGKPAPYEVPFGALVPDNLRNILVVSQAASFDSAAAFSARVAPLQMNLGEAAGLAVATASRRRLDIRSLASQPSAMNEVRAAVRQQGLVRTALGPGKPCRDEQHPNYDIAVQLLRRGLFSTPYYYVGCLHLAEPQRPQDFLADLTHAAGRAGERQQAQLDLLRSRISSADAGVSTAEALTMLRTLAPTSPQVQLASNTPQLDRGRAALLRWEALRNGVLAGLQVVKDKLGS